ncbi:hypothetical protein IWZ01DRAFT_483082 [Phyllosticta capitalensis]
MSNSWASNARSQPDPQPTTTSSLHACVGGLLISTCPTCAGHPQGYRNPICNHCKGMGVVTEMCRQCPSKSSNTSATTSLAGSPNSYGGYGGYSGYGSSLDQRLGDKQKDVKREDKNQKGGGT